MSKRVCKLGLKGLEKVEVELLLARAIKLVEALRGTAPIRLAVGYLFSDSGDQLVLDMTSTPGEHVALVLIHFLTEQYGETAFTVDADVRAERWES